MEQSLSPKWNIPALLAFRFFFVYFILFLFPFPLGYIPFSGYLFQPVVVLMNEGIEAMGPFLLGSSYRSMELNGSGDSSFQYARVISFAGLSLFVMIVWSFLDRRQSHPKLATGLNVALRYFLAGNMLSYGFIKVFPTQFPPPSDAWLNQTYGESSPMRLLWTFMGYSKTYTIFSGVGEVVGGLLLLFRKTRLIGSLIVAGVMAQVVMLNFSYDVPVKLFSLHLLGMALFIMTPDFNRLVGLFFLNKTVEPSRIENYFHEKKLNIAVWVVKGILLIMIIVFPFRNGLRQYNKLVEHFKPKAAQPSQNTNPTLFGEFEVETFVLNNDTLPPREDDTRRWRSVMISARAVHVKSMDGYSIAWNCLVSKGTREVTVMSKDGFTTGKFSYTLEDSTLLLTGALNDNQMVISSRRKSDNPFLLIDRGFHWINEFPFNQ
jgi:hypothetical protein